MKIDTPYSLRNSNNRIGTGLRHFDKISISLQNKSILIIIYFCFFRKYNFPQFGTISKKNWSVLPFVP